VSTIQFEGLGRLLAEPTKSSLQVREKPGMEGTAPRVAGRLAMTARRLRVRPMVWRF
jgi:hypothetical protein